MIGVIPAASRTYEVYGDFNTEKPIEGKIYYDPKDLRLYYYSTIDKRSNPGNGYFPIWDGTSTYSSKFSNEKFFDKDVVLLSVEAISKSINQEVAKDIKYRQRRALSDEILKPQIENEDNSFTQIIKGIIRQMEITIVDLFESAYPKLDEKQVTSYYSALNKITYMRLEKFHVWMGIILKLKYEIVVYKKNRKILTYKFPDDTFNTGIVKYDNVIKKKDDCLKKCIKILMVMENINKTTLKVDANDDYTVNNMMTTIYSNKPMSAQLFSRFIRMAHLTYRIKIYNKDDKMIFQFKE